MIWAFLAALAGGVALAIQALASARLAEAIDWPGGFYRRDIGWRALGR